MAFTYSAALTTNKDRVRFLLQDTTNTTARPNLLDDDEITWVLTVEMNIYMAAALCADALASRFRGQSQKIVGNLSITYSSVMWSDIAKKLRARGSMHMVPTAGGITITDRDAIWENTDLLRPSFFSRLHEDPEQLPPTRNADLTEEKLP